MIEHEGHGHHHGTGIPWLDLVLAGAAILISVISLVVSVRHGRTMERLVEANEKQVKAATLAVTDRLVVFDSPLPQLLDDVDRRVASASVLMLVTVVQAEVLALFALVIALQRLARSRSAEWAVGRLRGMPRRSWLR